MSDKSVVVAASGVVANAAAGTIAPASRYAQLLQNADVFDGHALVDQAALVGVPFIVTGVTVREGVPQKDGKNTIRTNYLSIELIVADKPTLLRYIEMGRLAPNVAKNFEPCEQLVFNDGSTGVARQVVSKLHETGAITVPDGSNDGPMGTSRWDIHRSKWNAGWTEDNPDLHFPNLAWSAPRGLRVSGYTNDFGDAETYYIG